MNKTLKAIITERMGYDFVEAIYQGTTDTTLVAPFAEAMKEIAEIVEQRYITRIEALNILTKHNPDREYNPRMFFDAFPKDNAKDFDPATMTRATDADIARIWEQCWGVVSLPNSDWAMLEDGELLDLWQIRNEVS